MLLHSHNMLTLFENITNFFFFFFFLLFLFSSSLLLLFFFFFFFFFSSFLQVTAVGDDDQVIYGFAGSNPGVFDQYFSRFDGCLEMRLEQNYRSTSTIIRGRENVASFGRLYDY